MSETDPTACPERIDLIRADDARDVVHRAVACLAQGGIVGVPTEVGYALAACALRPLAVSRLVRETADIATDSLPIRLVVKGADELDDWVFNPSPVARRLARRSWPGPLLLEVTASTKHGLLDHLPAAVRSAVCSNSRLALRCPDHTAIHDILQLIPGPLVLVEQTTRASPPPRDVDSLLALLVPDLVLDEGPIPPSDGVTSVRLDGESWKIDRIGVLGETEITARTGLHLLFVCTGNTCRSPMAEALCRQLLAERLGCAPANLAQRGFVVMSAGVGAFDGMPASPEAVEVIGERGGSLVGHASRRVTLQILNQADLIVTMTAGHRDTLLAYYPEVSDRVRLLDPEGGDIADPIGCEVGQYRRTAEQIEVHLASLIRELPA